MALALVAQPPARAPWARCLLRRDAHTPGAAFCAEFKTDWTADEALRQSRKVIFEAMVRAVKQLPGGASFDQTKKFWLLKGGVTASRTLIHSLQDMGFRFSDCEVQNFLKTDCPKAPFEDEFAKDDEDLEEWLSTGKLQSIEKSILVRAEQAALPITSPQDAPGEPLQSDPAPQRPPEENAPSQADAASTSRREVAQAAYGDPKVEGVFFGPVCPSYPPNLISDSHLLSVFFSWTLIESLLLLNDFYSTFLLLWNSWACVVGALSLPPQPLIAFGFCGYPSGLRRLSLAFCGSEQEIYMFQMFRENRSANKVMKNSKRKWNSQHVKIVQYKRTKK